MFIGKLVAASIASTCAILIVLVSTGTARAGDTNMIVVAKKADVPTRSVSYADLDLALPAAQHVLHGRVGRAVTQVCEIPQFDNELARRVDRLCIKKSWSRAQPQIDRAIEHARSVNLAQAGTATLAAK